MTEKVSAEDTALTSSDTVQPTDSRPAEGMKMVHPDPSGFRTLNGDAYFTVSGGSMNADVISRRILEPRNVPLWKIITGCLSGGLFICALVLLFLFFPDIMLQIISWLLLLSLVPCIYLMFRMHLFITAAQQMPGKVVSYRESSVDEGTIMYDLNVEYWDQYGGKHTLTSRSSSNPPAKNIGDPVIVLKSWDGAEAKLFIFEDTYMPYVIWLCIGIAVSGFFFGQDLMEWLYM